MSERDLAHFGKISAVARYGNYKFTAKQIRSNCVLYNSDTVTVNKNSYHLTKKLKERERSVWNPEQNECADNHMEKKIAEGIRQRSYLNRLLSKCKTWNGPCTSVQELQRVLSIHGDIEQQIVRTELSYYKHTHPADVTARSHLFSLNTVTHEQRLDNLCCLLDDEGQDASHMEQMVHLPSNEEALQILKSQDRDHTSASSSNDGDIPAAAGASSSPEINVDINELCVTVWENGWYLGYVLEINTLTVHVEHLQRVTENDDSL